MATLHTYIVLYRTLDMSEDDAPYGFYCEAEGSDEAELKCANSVPNAYTVWVLRDGSYEQALEDFDRNYTGEEA